MRHLPLAIGITSFNFPKTNKAMRAFSLIVALLLFVSGASAQTVAVKTNLASDALLNANIGAEMRVAPRWSIDLTGDFNFWTLSHDRKWKHWIAQPEARYWFCDAISGSFLAFHLLGGEYNVAGVNLNRINFLNNDFFQRGTRTQGWFVGAGVGYGFSFPLGRHWNLEAELAFGYAYGKFDRYPCANCGSKLESDKKHHYVGPTKAAVNLVYVF